MLLNRFQDSGPGKKVFFSCHYICLKFGKHEHIEKARNLENEKKK